MNESYEFILDSDNDTTAINSNVSYSNIADQMIQVPLPFTILCIVAGTIGNGLVCLAILLNRKLQNLTNYFLFSLALSGLLVSILFLPIRIFMERYEFNPSIFPLCFLCISGENLVAIATSIHICFISIERYFAIRNPLNRRNLTKKWVAIKLGLVWGIAFLTIIPYIIFAIITKHPNQPTYCDLLFSSFVGVYEILLIDVLANAFMIMVVFISFILTSSLLYGLAKKQEENTVRGRSGLVRTVGGKITNQSDNKSNKKKALQVPQTEMKALKVVWLVTFAFIICMVLYPGINVIDFTFPDLIIPSVCYDISTYLYRLYYVTNPIIYTIFSKAFRNDFKSLILCKYKKDKQARKLTVESLATDTSQC